MKIASASLQMASSHTSQVRHETTESLRFWVGRQRPDFNGDGAARSRPAVDTVSLSEAGKAALAGPEKSDDADETGRHDPKLDLIRSMLEFLTGRRIRLFDFADLRRADDAPATTPPAAPQQAAADETPPAAGYGLEYDYHESYSESEQTSFAASGTVTTADGRRIDFTLQLAMQRSYQMESDVSLRLGDATRKAVDPLTLNFSGTAAQLTDQRFSFDLDADGSQEQINFAAPGSGFLAFDRNRDGKINDGSELFGPTSGDGFGELAVLDDDRNGWIDENDAAFNQLQVWSKDAAGQDRMQSLAAAGVGAISLNRVATPFAIKDYDNELLGNIRNSGIFLQEDGRAGTIQQIDLTA